MDARPAGAPWLSFARQKLDEVVALTTTIGSFPQTRELRKARADLRAGRRDEAGYRDAMRAEIASVIAEQERLGLDVLVHGEPERNDMVQYFAEQLAGYVVTARGWVQSYGTRYVRPPIQPALRETLPLRAADRGEYLQWAVRAFRLAMAGVTDDTQVHTPTCATPTSATFWVPSSIWMPT